MKLAPTLLTLLVLTASGGAARAQTPTRPAGPPSAATVRQAGRGYCLMKDGTMVLVKGGKMTPMTTTLTMSDGSFCMVDGTCQRPNGATLTLREGQSMLLNGQLMMQPGLRPGNPARPLKK